MTVFEFKGYFQNDNDMEIQTRYVMAETTEEACYKLDKYVEEMVERGFARFIFDRLPTVEVDNVIV